MDLKSLNYFVHAAETLNFTKAAKDCYISQTAISLSIAKMEEELGFRLFERNNRSMRLTPAGHEFFGWAQSTLHSYQRVVEQGQNIANGYVGTVNIGFGSVFEALWFLPQLQAFQKRFCGVNMEQRIMEAQDLLPALQNRDVDAVVAPPYEYANDKLISVQTLADFPMVLIVGKEHPFAAMNAIAPELLHNEHAVILTYRGMPHAERFFNAACQAAGIQFSDCCQMDHLEEVLLYLINNRAVALLPEFITAYLNDFAVARPIILPNPMILQFSFCYLKSNKNPALTALDLALQQSYAKR